MTILIVLAIFTSGMVAMCLLLLFCAWLKVIYNATEDYDEEFENDESK